MTNTLDALAEQMKAAAENATDVRFDTERNIRTHIASSNPANVLAVLAELAAARALLAKAGEALEPFGKAGELFEPRTSDEYDMLVYSPAAGKDYNLCGDHLRAARAVFAEIKNVTQGATKPNG